MKRFFPTLGALLIPILASGEVYDGYDLPGYGREIDLIGEHEALPELAKILAKHYGFRCNLFGKADPERAFGPAHLVVLGPDVETEQETRRPVLQLGADLQIADETERRDFVAQVHRLLGLDGPPQGANVELVENFDPNPEDPYVENPPELPYFDVTGGRDDYDFAVEPVNRFRLYDFYRRQALYHLDNPGEQLLPEYPSLDGGAFGHWGRFHKNAFRDQRWNWMNNGSVIAAIFRAEGAKAKPRSIMMDLGAGACAYDTETLRMSHFWTDGFVKFIPNRWGIGGGSNLDGKIVFSSKDSAGWKGEGQFLGYFQHGDRGVLKFKIEDAEMLELPGAFESEAGPIFTRTIEFLDASLTQQLLIEGIDERLLGTSRQDSSIRAMFKKGDRSAVVVVDESKMEGVTRILHSDQPDGAIVEFEKTSPGATATIYLWRGHSDDMGAAFSAIRKHEPSDPPSTLTKGGPKRWDWNFEAAGELGEVKNGFAVDRIPVPLVNPYGSPMLIGGHGFFANGDAAVCTMMGDVWIVSGLDEMLEKVTWRRFATGLNQALGLEVIDDQVHAIGRDRITRLHDLNEDGEADFYENVADSFPASTGGHDFTVGLQRDGEGNFYTVAAGDVVRIKPDGSSEVIASGLRNANGVGASADGIVTTSTNEGDWTPASAVFEVRQDDFYGRRAKPDQEIAPPLCFIPRGVDNSSGGQIFVDSETWNPLEGALVHTSFGYGTWSLILRDTESGDRPQGAVLPMRGDFNSGAHRARFSPKDGQLYLSGSDGWGNYAMDDGSFDRVRYVGGKLNLPKSWQAHANGILVELTDPIDPGSCSADSTFVQQWNYEYSPGYGSREYSLKGTYQQGHDRVDVASVQVLDERTLFFEMPAIEPVMQMHLVSRLKDADSEPFLLEMFPTILSLAEPRTFDGMQRLQTEKPTELVLRVRHTKGQEGAKIPKGGAEGRIVEIDMIAGLRFSVTEIKAKPKERLTFVLTNKDPMPHNFVLIEPGSLEKVGAASTEMLADPDAFAKHYVPEMDEVIWHSHLMEHSAWTHVKFNFDAPEEPGIYPYTCTFPGHWMIMKGQLIVK